ncbi:MAG: hypothetical protein V4735_08070 [Pseudomonadota bacterium]
MVDALLVGTMVFMPNLLMAVRLKERFSATMTGWAERIGGMIHSLSAADGVLWLAINFCMLVALFALRRHVVVPLGRIAQHVQMVRAAFEQEMGRPLAPLNVRMLARDVARFTMLAQDYYHQYLSVSHELEQSRHAIDQIALQQQAMLATTSREITGQYQSILAYANYLEEHIARKQLDPSLRYDFDDVCEASFNLKLIAGALPTLRDGPLPAASPVSLADLMQQTMLVLAPTLDRRSMRLTTAEVDRSVVALSDPEQLSQILWMLLLGTIRYAASESTLRLRSFYNSDGSKAMMSIVISELSPGSLSDAERGAYQLRQLQHLTPHMFADTIRTHANLQLAQLMLARMGAAISIVPLTVYACEISVVLPAYSPA